MQAEHESGMHPCDDESCVLGFISKCVLQVDRSRDSVRSTLSHFRFCSAKEDVENKDGQVGGH